jgi:membrane protease YdiL (CAAX protease family)
MVNRPLLALEFLLGFLVLPWAVGKWLPPIAWFPLLWAVACLAWWHDAAERAAAVHPLVELRAVWSRYRPTIRLMVVRFLLAASAITLGLFHWAPDRMFSLVRHRPGFWALVMVIYPVLSVYPQELLYRRYLFSHYRSLFRSNWLLVAVSAVVFGWLHIIFRNYLACIFTLIGGIFFADTFRRTRSLWLACIEHILYGQFIFTIGLGEYFRPALKG